MRNREGGCFCGEMAAAMWKHSSHGKLFQVGNHLFRYNAGQDLRMVSHPQGIKVIN